VIKQCNNLARAPRHYLTTTSPQQASVRWSEKAVEEGGSGAVTLVGRTNPRLKQRSKTMT